MMDCVLGIDLGTSYFKLALFDADGRIRGSARISVPKRVEGNRCELDADVFWQVLRAAVAQVCAEAGITARQIVALSYASQANSFLLLDSDNAPLTPLVLWPDRRASIESRSFTALWNRPDFLEVTGLGLCSTEFMAAKICWFQQHAPETWARTRRIMTISDYLVYGATGEFRGDESTASLLGLWDVRAHAWWEAACNALEIPASYLATSWPTGDTLDTVSLEGASRLGLPPRIPLVAGGLDHYMAAIGAGLGSISPAVDSTGTVLALLANCTHWHPRAGCCLGPARHRGRYYQMAFSDNGAAVLEWYQRVHASEYTLQELLDQAANVSTDADGLVARPSADHYPGLEGFLHASPRHRHGHYIRALLESSAAELAQLAATLFGETAPACIAATGGGARSDLWMQIKADAVGAEFVVTACPEPACLGAALVAAVAAKWFDDVEAASAAWIVERRRFVPQRIRMTTKERIGMHELQKGLSISVAPALRQSALAAFQDQIRAWNLSMPRVDPLVLDFGLHDFDRVGLIEYWICNEVDAGYCGKYLFVFDGQTCPMHRHKQKIETFFIVKGTVSVNWNGQDRTLCDGDSLLIERGVPHAFTGIGPALVLEVSTPCLIDDNYFENSNIPIGGNYGGGALQ